MATTARHRSAMRSEAALVWFGRAVAVAVLTISILNWVGWATGTERLTRVLASWPNMPPWTAALQAILGIAILVQLGRPPRARVWVVACLAAAAGVLAVVFLAEYATGTSFGLDGALFSDAVSSLPDAWPGRRPSTLTALSVLLLSVAVGVTRVDRRWARILWSGCLAVAALGPFITVLTHLFELSLLMDVTRPLAQSVQSVLSLLLIGAATSLARPDRNPVAWLVGRPDLWTLIRLVGILAGLPIVVGVSRLVFVRIGLHGDAVWVLSITVATVVVGVAAVFSSQREQRLLIEKEQLSDRMRLLVDHLPALIGYWDHAQRNVVANHAYVEFFGREPSQVYGRHMREILGESLYAQNLSYIRGALAGEEQHFDRTLIDQRGDPRYTQTSYVPDVSDGVVRGFYVLVTDVSERVKAEQERSDAEARYRIMAENSVDVVIHLRGIQVVWISPSVHEAFGDPPEQWIGSDILTRIHPDDLDTGAARLQDIATGKAAVARIRFATAEGGYRWVEARGKPYVDAAGGFDGVMGSIRIIDGQVEAERQLQLLARTDPLTGLANRGETITRLESALRHPREPGPNLGVLFCDVDHFKSINDTWGHTVGDLALTTVAERIRKCLRQGDTVGRIGGDEMLVQLPGVHNIDEVAQIAENIRHHVAEPIRRSSNSIHVTLSIGATLATPGESVADLTTRVDAAMYQAKQAGRNTVRRI